MLKGLERDRSIKPRGQTALPMRVNSGRLTHRTASRFAWAVLIYMLGVILWGAYVRASGSGAGCGNHWPLCNGEVIPTSPSTERLIEFTHRLTSGLALISVLVLLYLTWRATTRHAWARVAALMSVVFMLNEALLGALLVLLQHVGNDQSASRAVFLSLHFANTLLLIGSITLTADWLSHPPARRDFSGKEALGTAVGLLAVILIGVSGALAALGDTLFPATSLSGSLSADFSAASHFLLRLRLLHPVLAVVGAAYVIWLFARCIWSSSRVVRRLALALTLLVLLQLCLGALNVFLLAPVWLQMMHLLVGDLVWVVLILVSDQTLRNSPDAADRHHLARTRRGSTATA